MLLATSLPSSTHCRSGRGGGACCHGRGEDGGPHRSQRPTAGEGGRSLQDTLALCPDRGVLNRAGCPDGRGVWSEEEAGGASPLVPAPPGNCRGGLLEQEEGDLSISPSSFPTAVLISQSSGKKRLKFLASRNVPRPQVRFRDQVDNSNSVFVPLLRSKPNARQPLPQGGSPDSHVTSCDLPLSLSEAAEPPVSQCPHNQLQGVGCGQEKVSISPSLSLSIFLSHCSHTHPYQFELENFVPTEAQLQISEPQVRYCDVMITSRLYRCF